MEIRYSLVESDVLNFQMYSAGSSRAVSRRKLVGRLILLLVPGLMGLVFWSDGDRALAMAFVVFGISAAMVLPWLIKKQHRKHFKNHIREKCQGMLGAEVTLRLEDSGLRSSGSDSDGVVKYAGIETLIELDALFLIRLKQGLTLIVPKSDVSGVASFMEMLSERADLAVQDHCSYPWAEPNA